MQFSLKNNLDLIPGTMDKKSPPGEEGLVMLQVRVLVYIDLRQTQKTILPGWVG
jgi:hypothetical protein